MAAATLVAVVIGGLHFVKHSGDRRANFLYGTLLLAGGLTQLHFLLDFTGYFRRSPDLQYLPIYYSLWLPVLLFCYVKISLYPKYQFRWSDLKHLSLPIGQTPLLHHHLALPRVPSRGGPLLLQSLLRWPGAGPFPGRLAPLRRF